LFDVRRREVPRPFLALAASRFLFDAFVVAHKLAIIA